MDGVRTCWACISDVGSSGVVLEARTGLGWAGLGVAWRGVAGLVLMCREMLFPEGNIVLGVMNGPWSGERTC